MGYSQRKSLPGREMQIDLHNKVVGYIKASQISSPQL
jgi:hypothetical protein